MSEQNVERLRARVRARSSPPRSQVIAAAVGAMLLVVVLATAPGAVGSSAAPAFVKGAGQDGPNVVVLMTDDQTLASMNVMPETTALIGAQGATLENNFASFPLCCPSRATFLTGQYAHNHRVLNNIPPQGGFEMLDGSETLPVWLQRAGYYTALIGKYLNGYEQSSVGVPPGYSEWHGQKTQNAYYGYDLFEEGRLVRYGDPAEDPTNPADPASYSTDLYTEKAVEFIGRRAPLSQPFFLWVAYNAPHNGTPEPPPGTQNRCAGNVKPAARHLGVFEAVPLPMPPSFNEADISDKPPAFRSLPMLDDLGVMSVHDLYRCELESLLAVDESVSRIVGALSESGELDDTLIIFTSDNGQMHGEHRIPFGKNLPYEESIRVPLLIRGPSVPAGVRVRDLAANVDLAPTILAASGAHARLPQDGHSLFSAIAHPGRQSGRTLAIEGNRYRGVRTSRYLYVRYIRGINTGAVELYDLDHDPYELRNLDRDRSYNRIERVLATRLREIEHCRGEACLSTPRIRLRLADQRSVLDPGRCRGSVVAAVRGGDVEQVVETRFSIGRSASRIDRSDPFKARFRSETLRRSRRIRASVELLDGRRMTVEATAHQCATRNVGEHD